VENQKLKTFLYTFGAIESGSK